MAKLLIVDDQPDIQLIVRMSLRRLAWQGQPLDIHTVDSGEASVQFIQDHPDTCVVIMDVMMEHERAGLDATLAIHKMNPKVQVIIHTAQAALFSEQEVILNYPIINYLTKSAESSQKLANMVLLAFKNYERLLLS